VTYNSLTFRNVSALQPLAYIASGADVVINNINIIDCTVSDSFALLFGSIAQTTINTFNIQNFAISNSVSNSLIDFEISSRGILTLNDFSIIDATLDNSDSIMHITSSNGTFIANNMVFSDIEMLEDASVIKFGEIAISEVTNMSFIDISITDSDDITNQIIDLGELVSKVNSRMTFTNTSVRNSKVKVMSIANSGQSKTINQYITFNDFTLKDCYFSSSEDLIYTGNVKSDAVFSIVFNRLMVSNITFVQNGNIMYLRHQVTEPLQIIDSEFSDIVLTGITIRSFNIQSLSVPTRVSMSNFTAHDIDGQSRSFIIINDKSYLSIDSSQFYYISNIRSGAVLYGGITEATADISDSQFFNNTSLEGGVMVSESKSLIKCTNCTFTNNLAISSGVIKAKDDGYYELYRCTIRENRAIVAPVSEVFSTQLLSVIDNCIISENYALDIATIRNEYITQSK